ncbi:hypothetical protein CspHIS471_0302530 [Cutaneotrichosporon sp. HIS471]|nr:hypothetical protein CspHIS471_0302530 [Cutaneotrichosporon sp. HIS471]
MRPRMIRARPLPGHCDNLEQTCVSIRCEVFVGRAPIPRPGPFMPKQVQAERVVIVLDSSFWGYLQSAAELWLHHFDQAEEIVLIFKDQWADNNMGVRSFFARALSYYITSPDPDSNQIIGRLKMVNFDLNPLIEVDPEIRFPPVTLPMRMLLQAELTNVPANFPLLRGALPGSVDNITFLTLQEYREEVGLDQFTLEYEV